MKYSTAWATLRRQIQQKIEEESARVKKNKSVMTACDASAKTAAYGNVLSMMNEMGLSLTPCE